VGLALNDIDCMIVASSSGGTQAGLAVGARATGYKGRIVGIGIDRETSGNPGYRERLAGLARECAGLLDVAGDFQARDFRVKLDYLGGGYGVVGEAEREAIGLAGRLEGLLLDPVYTGRAMAGLIDMVRQGQIRENETVLFWHTGGTPALFAYAHELV
jgi:D-cysteine desulfhydrase